MSEDKPLELPPGFKWDDDWGDMCPNCNTPWKCNGPHLQPPGGWERYRHLLSDRKKDE